MRFIKLDLSDEDEPVKTIVEAESIESLLADEKADAMDDDRFEPCYGLNKVITTDEDSLSFEPGDGGSYTMFRFWPDTEEGHAACEAYLE